MPLGIVKGIAEKRLSARFQAPVTIVALDRLDPFSLHPRVRIHGVRITQPRWAGTGDFVVVDEAIVRIPLLPLLHGAFRPESIEVRGATANLVRDANGRANWKGSSDSGGHHPRRIEHLTLTNGRLTLRDGKRHMTLDAALSADSARGITVNGSGTHRGRPMRLAARGGPVEGQAADRPWPLTVAIDSPLLRMRVSGRTDVPLDLDKFDAVMAARGQDIAYLDDVIEAGLPGTQDFELTARVRRDRPNWNIKAVAGRIGRSDLNGAVRVSKRDGRTFIEGRLDAGRLDFNDLSSDAGLARAVAKRHAIGPRVIPDTAIHFEKLAKVDGRLDVSARELLFAKPSLFRGFRGRLTMDRRVLTISPLTIILARGTMSGSLAVDHRTGDPKLRIDLRQRSTYLSDLMGGGENIDGPIEARLLLAGTGRTMRAAVAHADGRVALAMSGGSMRKQLAVLASGDVLASLGQLTAGDKNARVPVNCLIANFAARGGDLRPTALLLDSPVGRSDGTGQASLAAETIALSFAGRSKHPDPLQLASKVHIGGSFSQPTVSLTNASGQIPRKRGLFGKIGSFLGSIRTSSDRGRGLPVPAANCPALTAAALR